MKICLTGAAGYIGSTLAPTLLAANHSVTAVDNFRYGPQQALALAACCANPNFELVRADVRDFRVMRELVKSADVVIPLAALVGAPLCDQYPDDATTTNRYAVEWLAAQVSKSQLIVYPNTNSGYGVMSPSNAPLDETAPLTPISHYGRTKCAAERAVLDHPNSVVFRLATVFGASPRMRTDLLVNDFVLRAVRDRSCMIFQPNARRNFVHVRDVADAFAWAIIKGIGRKDYWSADAERAHRADVLGKVFNLGHDGANVTKAELCSKIADHVPDFQWYFGEGDDPDKRDYLISNERVRAAGFTPQRTLDDGIKELIKLYRSFPQTQYGNV